MRAKEFLSELLDRPLPIKWEEEPGYVRAYFDVSGKEGMVKFYYEAFVWTIDFFIDGRHDITGQGNELAIFSTVSKAILEFISKHNPNLIAFSAKEPSRAKLYKRMSQRLTGYTIDPELSKQAGFGLKKIRGDKFINESKTTLNNMYGGHFPDRDEDFWDYVTPRELDQSLTVETMPKHKVLIMLLSQYRAEHIDEITDMLDDDQQEIVQSYINDPSLSSKTIVIANNKIIDGNHRALAAAIKGVPINYVNLAELDEEPIDEAELDSTGWGATPQGTDVDYFGLKVKMRPSTFLKLSHPLNAGEQNSDVEKHMQGGGKIAYPFLEIKDPVEWEDGDFSQQGKVVNHEGRNRMTHWIKMKGDEPIQVNVFLRGANRRRYVTDDMIQALSQGLISQTGQLVKNPFEASTALDEAEVGTSNAKAIATQLKAAGYSNVGTGADSTVWAKDDSHIIKILMPEDLGTKAEQVFRKFYEFAMSHQDLECIPRFNEINTIDINGKDYLQIEMERLAPIEKGTFMEGVIWFFSDFCQARESWDKVDHAMGLSDTWEWYPYAKSSKSIANVYIRQWQDLMYDKKSYSMYRQLYNVMKLLYNTGTINKFGWDLHTANVMQRGNGQPVIIDPWFSEGTS